MDRDALEIRFMTCNTDGLCFISKSPLKEGYLWVYHAGIKKDVPVNKEYMQGRVK